MKRTKSMLLRFGLVAAISMGLQSTAFSADTPPAPLTTADKAKVQELLKDMSTHLHDWSNAYKEGRNNLDGFVGIEGVSEPDLKAAQAAYRALLGMGKKILPELIVGLGERKPAPYPVGEVESLIFDLEGQPMVIEYIANGKLKSTGFKAVENMFEYEDWRRTWFLPLFSSNVDAARELACTALPRKYRYCWEEWETHGKDQPMLVLHQKAARMDKNPRLRILAVSALGQIHEIIANNEADEGFSLRLGSFVEEVEGGEKPGKTIGDEGKIVGAWRAKIKPKREEQKNVIAHALCDMLEHDADVGVRRECAKQLRKCEEPFVEKSISKGAKDADAQVRDECALFLMKQASVKKD